ncbi:ergothioneine biosynthesis glutamate--cysteine ligase EgtA [Rhodococcus sp. NPDC127528]|uniref:ergothioneine biosynthesis glutamate--cysteine ligase EgtA n=1 Tax=unclassified Rhodococcus (in: high G+C Gram-positive bacteria) TaxID=192944 RepID=UPI0036345EE3
MAVTLAREVKSARLTTRAAAEAYVGGVCFKLGPPRLIGAELEWLTLPCRTGDPSHPARADLHDLATALGPHAPTSIAPDSPARPLPAGSAVTLEPGGQVELSSTPLPSVEELCAALTADAELLRSRLARAQVTMVDAAADTSRQAERVLQLPRYRAMEERFDRIGPYGRLMMCNTAATQVSVDAGADAAEVSERWSALYAMGPALLAAFACSPRLHGIPDGEWASQRMRAWFELDVGRTDPPPLPDPIAEYGRWALDAPMLCVIGGCGDCPDDWSLAGEVSFADWISGALDDVIGRRPDYHDLDYHLSTLFPPVRPAGHLEVRYLDAQPGELWRVPIAALAALLGDRGTIDEAAALCAGTAGRWRAAAEFGLREGELRCTATDLLELAASRSRSFSAELSAAAQRCRRGRTPTQEAGA